MQTRRRFLGSAIGALSLNVLGANTVKAGRWRPMRRRHAPVVVWTETAKDGSVKSMIKRAKLTSIPIHSHNIAPIYTENCNEALRDIAVDIDKCMAYITNSGAGKIFRLNLDRPQPTVTNLYGSGLTWGLEGIAIDPTHNKLYAAEHHRTDPEYNRIYEDSMDGDGQGGINLPAVLISGQDKPRRIDMPRGVFFDVCTKYIYWAEESGGIRWRKANGNVVTPNFPYANAYPFGIAVDHNCNRIYWSDQKRCAIVSANLPDLSDCRTIAEGLVNPGHIALDLCERKIYWADGFETCNDKICRSNLDGSTPELVVSGAHGTVGIDVFVP